jgi:hypothetical protein
MLCPQRFSLRFTAIRKVQENQDVQVFLYFLR